MALPGALVQLSILLAYMAFQATLNLYMKFIMSSVEVAPGVRGIPASFLVTGLQQLVAFSLFLPLLLMRRRRRARLASRPGLSTLSADGHKLVFFLSLAFAGNMSLNNFSLAFVPLSVNQVIRACAPLATATLQVLLCRGQRVSGPEWLCMLLGVACAATTVVARTQGNAASCSGFVFGTSLCIASVLFAGSSLILLQMMGSDLKLSPVDAMGYMALPSFLLLLAPGLFWQHPVPVEWVQQLGSRSAGWTDAAVIARGCMLRPAVLGLIMLSGVLAFGYNTFTTFVAVRLSATTASLVGNLPASTLFSLLVLENCRPRGAWDVLLWASIAGNVAAFAAYTAAKRRRLRRESA